MSVRICVLASGSQGNATWVATDKTRLLIDAGLSRRETYRRLAAVGECPETCDAILITHEHHDHVSGLQPLANDLKVPVFLTPPTRAAIHGEKFLDSCEVFNPGVKFTVGDIEIAPFTVPHDALDPVAFTLQTQGIKIGLVTDLGCLPEMVKQKVRGCHCLVLESNHDLEMLKIGPYPWHVKQRVMSRHGHLSNLATAQFLREEFDRAAQVLVLAHLSRTNNHPEIARLAASEALEQHGPQNGTGLYLASQSEPTPVFRF